MILQKKDKIIMASEVLRKSKEVVGNYSLRATTDIWGVMFMEFLAIDMTNKESDCISPRILIGLENPIDGVYMWTKVVEDFPFYIQNWFDDLIPIGEDYLYSIFERNLPLNFKYVYKNNNIIKTKDGWKIKENEFPLVKNCIEFIENENFDKI